MQKPIKEAIQMLNLYLKQNYIAQGMNISNATLNNKMRGSITRASQNNVYISRFIDEDIRRFNAWMPRLAEELRSMRITWSEDRQTVVDQVKRFRKIANIYYISEHFLGFNVKQTNIRCLDNSTKQRNTSFNQQDIDKLNSFISSFSSVVSQLEAQ